MKAGRHFILNFTIKYDKNSIFLTSADISVCQQLSDLKLENTVHVFIILQWYHHLFYLQLFLLFFAFPSHFISLSYFTLLFTTLSEM